MDTITVGPAHVPIGVVVDAIIAIVSSILSWWVTRRKRANKELPPIIAPYVPHLIDYTDLKAAYDHAEGLYRDPEVRRKAFIEKIRDITMEKVGVALPDFVVNYLAENAVAWAKSGWAILKAVKK